MIGIDSGGTRPEESSQPHDIPDAELKCYLSGGGVGNHNLSLLLNGGSGGGNFSSLFSDLLEIFPQNQAGSQLKSHESHTKSSEFTAGGSVSDLNSTGLAYCATEWDNLKCWPKTEEGQTVTLPCFEELNGIFYDTLRNATRFCMEGGNWTKSDYSECRPLNPTTAPSEVGNLAITTGVYFFGYCVSLCALVIAIIIFLAFKELRCLRNTIHTHLMITYVLADTLWIITSSTTMTSSGNVGSGGSGGGSSGSGIVGTSGGVEDAIGDNLTASSLIQEITSGGVAATGGGQSNQVPCITFILLHYFHLTNFFWMFVEGLYLYVLVVKTFVSENIKLRVYACIGWGVPLTVVITWSIAKWITQSESAEMQSTDAEFSASTCLWLPVNDYDWIYKTPVILVLAANLIFLLQIMWVLITKLRSAMNPETQQSIKAAKALVVLMPLLGITYVLVLSGSHRAPVYEYMRALLISTQGFLVALLYCFLNGEVRQAIRHRWNRLRMMGPVCCDFERRRHQMQHLAMARDWSPRSRTESIRYTCSSQYNLRKRDSISSSEATTVTTINCGFGSAGSGGGGYGNSFFHGSPATPGGGNGPSSPAPQPPSPSPHPFSKSNKQVPFSITRGWGRGGNGVKQYNDFQQVKPNECHIAGNGISPNSKHSNGHGTTVKFTNVTERIHLLPSGETK